MSVNKIILTVKQLNAYIKNILEGDSKLNAVYLKAEISNFTNHRSGHLYLTLKDEDALIRCVMFKSSAVKLKFTPKDGIKVIAKGRVSVFERDGQYQFYIDEMILDGEGDLNLAFLQLKERLSKEGLFDGENKKPIPKFPLKIGVITSPTGAAVRDIINILGRRMPIANVILYPVLVQGEMAPAQIIKAIEYFNVKNKVDTLIVGRGGGSLEELWAFNDEGVARAIFASNLPVISAVGHETDFTIADFVADLRAPTPSAAAELCVSDKVELMSKFSNVSERLKALLIKDVSNKRLLYNRFSESAYLQNPQRIVDEKRLHLDFIAKNLSLNAQKYASLKREKVSVVIAKLSALSPLSILSRGYNMSLKENGNIIKSIQEIQVDELLTLKYNDGTALCRVTEKRLKKNGK